MSGKRDEDPGSDMEVGMTTAERRRRRRRGGGLRVPSDKVPRSSTPTAPPAPVPEDPALAMSIAYSFTSDASGPVPRAVHNEISAPIAPDAMPTVIDPPSAVAEQDFEMKTREMSAVDLEALGLSAEASAAGFARMSSSGVTAPRLDRVTDLEVDVTVDTDAPDVITAQRPAVEPAKAKPVPGGRHKTVALSEEDLEEVRAATQPALAREATAKAKAKAKAEAEAESAAQATQAKAASPADTNRTMPLAAIDVEVLQKSPASEEPMSVPDIDIQELADRAESSGEIEVDVET